MTNASGIRLHKNAYLIINSPKESTTRKTDTRVATALDLNAILFLPSSENTVRFVPA